MTARRPASRASSPILTRALRTCLDPKATSRLSTRTFPDHPLPMAPPGPSPVTATKR
ncbi:hypothetical protein BN1723_020704 [Verticillium longisporum]|uniref:Uncharacterized protein n=1 Tax=Verticillium longisporum TaxID=100787 RepID=A0A0G4NR31_VERLO|nr:hypothetical protein BN1723_020704 [Verticillium longisporum]